MTPFERQVKSEPDSISQIEEGKNGAYLATYKFGQAVLKVAEPSKRGRDKVHGISTYETPYREVAYYRLAKLLGFEDVVPETVLMKINKRVASAQKYVVATSMRKLQPALLDESDKTQWAIKFRELMRTFPQEQCVKITLLDFIACARDRHASNLGARLSHGGDANNWSLVAWDNGSAFGVRFSRYHSVLHRYMYRHKIDLTPYWGNLTQITQPQLTHELQDLLSPLALDHLWLRLQFIIEYPHLVPWKALSQGQERVPEYREYFALPYASPDTRPSSSLYGLRRELISG